MSNHSKKKRTKVSYYLKTEKESEIADFEVKGSFFIPSFEHFPKRLRKHLFAPALLITALKLAGVIH